MIRKRKKSKMSSSRAAGLTYTVLAARPGSPRRRMLRAVRHYIEQGFAVLPLEPAKPGHPESGKRPFTAHGVDDATKDYENFLKLIRGRDDFNIGIATGEASGIIVIDRDPRNGSQSSFAALVEEFGKLPSGPKVKTGGGGFHNYFQCPEGISHAPAKLADGIDVKYDRGYVVAPPSKHASGVAYKWVRGRNPQETSLRKLGVNWVAALKSKAQRKGEHRTTVEVTVPSNDSDAATPREGHVQQGHRNNFLAERAGKLRAMGRSVAEVEAELLRLNEAICNPPLGRDEVVKVAHSSGRWATHQGPGEPSVTEQVVTQLLDREFASGAHLRFERDSQFYAFNRTHWCARDVKDIERHCHDIIKADFGSARQRLVQAGRDAIALLKVQQSRGDIDPLHFVTSPPSVINTLNGEIWLLPDGAYEFRAHSAKTGMRHVLQVEFDPHAKCPQFDRALAEIFANAKQPKQLAKVWHQLTGYIIQPTRPQAIIVMGVGEGGNGKSKLVQTIMKLLGPDAVYSGDIGQLEASQFGIGGLAGKLLFVDDDVKSRSQLPDGILKKISEGKELTGQRKHKDPFNFVNRATPLLLFNNVPSITDLSNGLQRRLMVFKFDRVFKEEEQDITLFDRIWATELPGILNRALQGWKRFVSNDHKFSDSLDLDLAGKELFVQGNPLPAFIDECCEKDATYSVGVRQLYEAYTAWAKESGYNFSIVRNTLKRQFIQLGFGTKRVNGLVFATGLQLQQAKSPLKNNNWT